MSRNKRISSGKAAVPLILTVITLIIFAAATAFFAVKANTLSSKLADERSGCEKIGKESLEIKNNYNKLKEDNAKLQLELQKIVQEKDNVASQIRGLLADRQLARELEGSVAKLKKDMETLVQEKQEILSRGLLLKEKIKDLTAIQKQLLKEKEVLGRDLAKERDKSGIKQREQENAALKKENNEIASALSKSRSEADKLGQENSRLKKDLKEANEKLEKFNKDYSEAVKKNIAFERRVSEAPAKFAELARQNKVLVRQTANMHYNLGVFYTKGKEYSRAAAEFEKAIELTPDDAYSHFNLGYIYAEYLIDKQKAIEHFRQYLRLAKSDDKDVDWVKNYILTWQTVEGKKPME